MRTLLIPFLTISAVIATGYPVTQHHKRKAVYFNDFNQPPGSTFPEWSSPGYRYEGGGISGSGIQNVTNVLSPSGLQSYLGEFGGPYLVPPHGKPEIRVNETIRLSLAHLTPHNRMTIAFDLYILKSWDGNSPQYGPDRFQLSAKDVGVLINTTFSNNPKVSTDNSLQDYPAPGSPPQTGATSIGTIGYNNLFKDCIYHFCFSFAHIADLVQFDFSSSLFEGKGTDDESWGLDNVFVSISEAE